jgi:hypothetical protein
VAKTISQSGRHERERKKDGKMKVSNSDDAELLNELTGHKVINHPRVFFKSLRVTAKVFIAALAKAENCEKL